MQKELDEILLSNGFTIHPDTIDYNRDFQDIMRMHAQYYLSLYKKKRIGEKIYHKTTKQNITIIDYIDYHHVTVRWDDGAIAKNKNYGAFRRGEIQHPDGSSKQQMQDRMGESRMMNCGSLAKIIAYRNAGDIDIQFEDNGIVEHVTYYNFSKGTILNPSTPHTQAHINRTGETMLMKCGLKATIIKYRNQYDMDIQFEDGVVVTGKKYSRFIDGDIGYPK